MKKAFSLIELLIVVLIIGVIYSMAIGTIRGASDTKAKKVNLKNLKYYLQSIKYEQSVKILCLDNCKSCSLLVDEKKDKELDESFDILVDDTVEIYSYEYLTGMQEKEKEIFFNKEEVEEDVCFSYTIDKKGIGDQVYIRFKEKVYDYTLDSGFVSVYNSLEEAQEAQEILREELFQ